MQAYQYLVIAAMGSSPSEVKKATVAIHSQLENPAFVAELCMAASDAGSLPAPARQLALVVLKNAPLCYRDARIATKLQDALPKLLFDPDVGRMAALALAKCIVAGDESIWFNAFTVLTNSSNARPTEPVLRCLSLVAQDAPVNVRSALVPVATQIANAMCDGEVGTDPTLLKLGFTIVGSVVTEASGLTRSAECFSAVRRLFHLSAETAFAPGNDVSAHDFELRSECLRFLSSVCHAASEGTDMPCMVRSLIARAVECLLHVLPLYFAKSVLVEDADGEGAGVAAYTVKLFELVAELLASDAMGDEAAAAVLGLGDWPATIVKMLVCYAVATADRIDEWVSHPHTYLKEEDERGVVVGHQTRDAVLDFVRLLINVRPGAVVSDLLDRCAALLAAEHNVLDPVGAEAAELAGWRVREGIIAILDVLATRAKVKDFRSTTAAADLGRVLQIVYARDLVCGGQSIPCLQSRALCLFGNVMRRKSVVAFLLSTGAAIDELVTLLIPACADALVSDQSPLLSVVSCRTLRPLLARASLECLEANMPRLPEAMIAFISASPFATEEVLYAALETLETWCDRVPPGARGGLEHAPEVLCIRCWKQNKSDPNVGELVVDIFDCLLERHPSCEESLLSCIPWFAEVLRGCDDPCSISIVPYVLRIVSRVLRNGSAATAGAAYEQLLAPLCSLILSNEDSAVVCTAINCVAAVVNRVGLATAATLQADVLPSALCVPPALPSLDEFPQPAPLPTVVVSVLMTALAAHRPEATLADTGRSLDILLQLLLFVQHDRTFDVVAAFVERASTVQRDAVRQHILYPLLTSLKQNPSSALQLLGPTAGPFLSNVLRHAQYFDGRPLTAAMGALAECLDHCSELGLETMTVTVHEQRPPLSFPVAAFVTLCRVVVALHDGECQSEDDEDEEEGEEENDTESDAESRLDENNDGRAASSESYEDGVSSPANDVASPRRRGTLESRIGDCLNRWTTSIGPVAAQYLSSRHRTLLQKIWSRGYRRPLPR